MIEHRSEANIEDFACIANHDEQIEGQQQMFQEKYLVNQTGTMIEKKHKEMDESKNEFYAQDSFVSKNSITNENSKTKEKTEEKQNFMTFYQHLDHLETLENENENNSDSHENNQENKQFYGDKLNTSKISVYSQNTQGTMIIHHNDTNITDIMNQEEEEEIIDTGTMIIKESQLEFTKSNKWHKILAEEKPKPSKEVKKKEDIKKKQIQMIKINQQKELDELINKIPRKFRSMNEDDIKKQVQNLQAEMNHEIQQIQQKYKTQILYIMKISETLIKIKQKKKKIQTQTQDAQSSSTSSQASREEKVKKAQFHMKFSSNNLEQAFYPVEEKIQPKRNTRKKRSKISDISITSKVSVSSIKSQDKKFHKMKYLSKKICSNLKKYKKSSRDNIKRSDTRKSSRRQRKRSEKRSGNDHSQIDKPESLLLFERLRKKNSIKKVKDSQYFRRSSKQSKSPLNQYKQRNKENLNKIPMAKKKRVKGFNNKNNRERRVSKKSQKSFLRKDSMNSQKNQYQNIRDVRAFNEDNSYLYGQNSYINEKLSHYRNKNQPPRKVTNKNCSVLNEKEENQLQNMIRKYSKDTVSSKENYREGQVQKKKRKQLYANLQVYTRQSLKPFNAYGQQSKNILNTSQINNSKRFRDYFLNH